MSEPRWQMPPSIRALSSFPHFCKWSLSPSEFCPPFHNTSGISQHYSITCHSAHHNVETPWQNSLHIVPWNSYPWGRGYMICIFSSSSDTVMSPRRPKCHSRHFLPAAFCQAPSCLQHLPPVLESPFPSRWALPSKKQRQSWLTFPYNICLY